MKKRSFTKMMMMVVAVCCFTMFLAGCNANRNGGNQNGAGIVSPTPTPTAPSNGGETQPPDSTPPTQTPSGGEQSPDTTTPTETEPPTETPTPNVGEQPPDTTPPTQTETPTPTPTPTTPSRETQTPDSAENHNGVNSADGTIVRLIVSGQELVQHQSVVMGGEVLIPDFTYVFGQLHNADGANAGFWSVGITDVNARQESASIFNATYNISIVEGEYSFTVNGESIPLTVPAQMLTGAFDRPLLHVPLFAIAEAIGATVEWNEAELSRELMGLHCWFHRNVVFSALIRGADIIGWKTTLTKTWIGGSLRGVAFDDLRTLLALHAGESHLEHCLGSEYMNAIADEVISLMEDGVFSRAEMRRIFADRLDSRTIDMVFSPWGGIFVYLAQLGKVAFRDMTSRNFDLISAEPTQTADDVLPELFRRYIKTYGPATLADASWFLGFGKDGKKKLKELDLDVYERFELDGSTYYYLSNITEPADIPELTLLSGFDPLIVSYTNRSTVLPAEHKSRAILKSGICLPTIAVNGRVAGLWNIKKNDIIVEFFDKQPKRITDRAFDLVDNIRRQTAGKM